MTNRCGPDHVHFQQVFRFAGRIYCRGRGCHFLYQTPCALIDLQRQHSAVQCSRCSGCSAGHAVRTGTARPGPCQRRKDAQGYRQLGFNIGNSVTPVVPIIIGDDQLTFAMWKKLFDEGVFVNPVISPATPPGHQLLRTSYMATHTDDQLDHVLEIFEKVGKELGVI